METVEEVLVHNPPEEGVKASITDETSELKTDTEVCQKSNGVAENFDTSPLESNCGDIPVTESTDALNIDGNAVESDVIVTSVSISEECLEPCPSNSDSILVSAPNDTTVITEEHPSDSNKQSDSGNADDVSTSSKFVNVPATGPPENITTVKEFMEGIQNQKVVNNDNVKFETEILVETNDNDVNELDLNSTNVEVSTQESANILTELGQNIELSEALRSSDNAENGDNNNHSVGQEIFNKEELLDILEGNDVPQPADTVGIEIEIDLNSGKSEAQLALEQLSRLKKTRNRKSRSSDVVSKRRSGKSDSNVIKTESISSTSEPRKETIKLMKEDIVEKLKKDENKEKPKKDTKMDDNIVNRLVEDWDDDEPIDDQIDHLEKKTNNLLTSTNQLVEAQDSIVSHNTTVRTSIDSATSDGPTPGKGNEDSQPQRRLGRVIKKKVIFDPDNPDTFTKSKVSVKKETQAEEPPLKKGKIEPVVQRPKSKSPVSKMHWKKPQPKNSKQNKRLSEVDKLLMDEGAVNMIYQLTPEAPKGKKNMRTKAEFIKKIQSSTPETKEMKFRERKIKAEEGEAKKIIGGKQRSSLSSSVKSPSVCEDFETHSADDSIIYRRHSSSSYSSACMSPRRLSDVESGTNQSNISKSLVKEITTGTGNASSNISGNVSSDIFIAEADVSGDIINKDDCLSLKEKLNSKLSLALNKRKRENSTVEKPMKQKKISKVKTKCDKYQFLTVVYDKRVAEICIRKTGSKTDIQALKELSLALEEIDARKDVSVTLLMSECGTLCSNLDLTLLVNENIDQRTNIAYENAEAIRLVMFAIIQHTKLLFTMVRGACSGVALALVALSDVALASDAATFALASDAKEAVMPGITLLSSPWLGLPQTLVKDLTIFGRRLSALEAQSGGLVSRVLWPSTGAASAASQIVREVAEQPAPSILLKKRLMSLKSVSSNTFLACLIKERDLIVNYWSSSEGQELLRGASTA